MLIRALLFSAGIPAALAAALLGVAWARSKDAPTRLVAGPALGLAYLAGHAAVLGLPAWPPRESTQWLFVLAIAGVAVGSLTAWNPKLRYPGLVFLSLGIPAALLQSPIRSRWTAGTSIGAVFGIGVCIALLWLATRATADRSRGSDLPAVWTLLAAGTAGAMQLSGSASLAQLVGALAAGAGALTVAAWWRPRADVRGAVPVAVSMLAAFWICGAYFIEVPLPSIGALALGAFAPHLARPRLTDGRPSRAGFVLAVGAALVTVLLALWWARPEPLAPGATPY